MAESARYLDKLHSPLFGIFKHAILLNGINGSIGCSTAQYAATIRTTLQRDLLELHFYIHVLLCMGSNWGQTDRKKFAKITK